MPNELTLIIRQAASDDSYELAYTNITEAGLSGGPIFDKQGRVVGIHGQVEGEDFQVDKLKLGLSLGIPIKKFLQLFERNLVQLPLVIDKELPNNSVSQSWSGNDPCTNNPLSRPKDDDDAIDWANYANYMLRLGKFDDALFSYDEAIKKNEKLELYQIWYGRGLMLILSERSNEALKNFDQALKIWNTIKPSDTEHKQNLDSAKALMLKFKGLLLSQAGRYQEALAAYNEVLKLKPNSYQVLLLKGNALRELNQNTEAITVFNNAIQLEPRSLAFLALSNLYIQTGQYDSALQTLNVAIQSNPFDPQFFAMRAALRSKLGDVKGTSADLEQVSKLTSQFPSTTGFNYQDIVRAQAEYSVGNTQEGAELFRSGLNGFGGERMGSVISNALGQALAQPDELRTPAGYANFYISMIRQMSNTEVSQTTIDIVRASSYILYASFMPISEEDIKTIFNSVDQAIQVNRNDKQIHIAYAIRSAFRENAGDIQASKEDFEQALRTDPLTFEAYSYRGMTYLVFKNKSRALSDLQTASQITLQKKDMDNYRKIMTLIDRIQGFPGQ